MGRGHTPEERGSAESVRGVGDGAAARAAESVAESNVLAGRAILARKASVRFALFALRFYKMYLSALMGGTCRFQPTCSNYAFEAVERFGVRRGCWLTLKRLARCQPLSRKFGFDPVPESWSSDEEEPGVFPQGLKPEGNSPSMSDLKVPPTNLVVAEGGAQAPVHQEAHS
jgi:uncharacterized protein